jgi:hypothetical protein
MALYQVSSFTGHERCRLLLQASIFTATTAKRLALFRSMSESTRSRLDPSFETNFLGGEAEVPGAARGGGDSQGSRLNGRMDPHNHYNNMRGGGDTYISQGNSRQIARLETHNHYNTAPPKYSPILEWLWPQSTFSSDSPAASQFTKQNTIHKSSTEARRHQPDPWLLDRKEYKEWLTGGSLWVRGKGKNVFPSDPRCALTV